MQLVWEELFPHLVLVPATGAPTMLFHRGSSPLHPGSESRCGPSNPLSQKEIAQRGAVGACRPASAIVGIGEQRGVRQVTRTGTGQVGTASAWAPREGAVGRELWAVDLSLPAKFCAACRGNHEPANEMNPDWQPYTPKMRLSNMHMLDSKFKRALVQGALCVKLNPDSRVTPIRWLWTSPEGDSLTPSSMGQEQFCEQLALMFDGLREGHEPYRHLATSAATAFLATGSPHLLHAVPALVAPLKLGLNTCSPPLVGHTLLVIQRLLLSHPRMGPHLAPHYKHLLPVMALFRSTAAQLDLPPPFCVGPTGSFTGTGSDPEASSRSCPVCGSPVDKEHASRVARASAMRQQDSNAALADKPLPRVTKRNALQGRRSKRYVLSELITATLELMVQAGGKQGLAVVKNYVPTFEYYNPK
ncbi:MAG: hypothetical protein WDW38_008138 [Sanguina aurantia]